MRFGAILRQRCPRCLRGPVFEGLFRMRTVCPECGLAFDRGQGYFIGAMYYSYAISIGVGLPVAVAGWLAGWGTGTIGIAATAAIVVAAPLSFRYSRVLWLHMDQAFDPR
jgi:hypothetical protein